MLQDKHGIDKSRTEVQEKPYADEGHPGVCQSLSANDPAPIHILIKEEGATAWLQGKEWSSEVTQFPPQVPTGSSADWVDAGTEGIFEHRVATQCCKGDVGIGGLPGGRSRDATSPNCPTRASSINADSLEVPKSNTTWIN
jgi:hypothetical protein